MRIAQTRVTVTSSGPEEERLIDTIEINEEWWLVGVWHSWASGEKAPAVLVRLHGHGLLSTQERGRDFLLCDDVPESVLKGEPQDGFEVKTIARLAAMQDDFDEQVMFSRRGVTAGKSSNVLKTNLPDDTYLSFMELAHKAGCTPSELLRDLVCLTVHGTAFGELTARNRRAILSKAYAADAKPSWASTFEPNS